MPAFVPVLATFSKAKTGKTIENIAAFPQALWIANDYDLMSAKVWLDYVPPNVNTCRTYHDVAAVLRSPVVKGFSAIGIDDITLKGRDTERHVRETEKQAKGQNAWNYVSDAALDMLDAAREVGVPVIFNGHERPGRTNHAGKYLRGGIDLPCELTEAFTARVDAAFRGMVITDEDEEMADLMPIHPHPRAYWGPPMHESWAVGNRIGVPNYAPANFKEILRDVGLYGLPPVPELAWMDKAIDSITTKLGEVEKADHQKILAEFYKKISKQKSQQHTMWCLRDAEDRATIKRIKTQLGAAYADASVG